MDSPKDEGLYINRTFLAALLTLCLAVLAASAKAFVDVVELKVKVKQIPKLERKIDRMDRNITKLLIQQNLQPEPDESEQNEEESDE